MRRRDFYRGFENRIEEFFFAEELVLVPYGGFALVEGFFYGLVGSFACENESRCSVFAGSGENFGGGAVDVRVAHDGQASFKCQGVGLGIIGIVVAYLDTVEFIFLM